jgi:hypothetical protein
MGECKGWREMRISLFKTVKKCFEAEENNRATCEVSCI